MVTGMNWLHLLEACLIPPSKRIHIWSGLSDQKGKVKTWYDGCTFGSHTDIYNPWSAINFLDTGKVGTYWANTSANSLAGKLIREGGNLEPAAGEWISEGLRLSIGG